MYIPTAENPNSVDRHVHAVIRASVAAALALGVAQVSFAAEAAEDIELEELVVTGTLIARDGYSAPTPVSVVTEEEIQAVAPVNIAQYVNTLPSVAGSTTPASSSGAVSPGGAGVAALNLRALGTNRTLVLFDGQRSVASTSTGSIDINTFPQSLIERVEVVTGGASSAYGSDAVGGVVNFILNRKFTGVKSEVQYGETFVGDTGSIKTNLTGGMPLAEGRGHVLGSVEYFNQNGVQTLDRDWAKENQVFTVQNTTANRAAGAPYYLQLPDVALTGLTPGGVILASAGTAYAGTLTNYYFGQGGTMNRLNTGTSYGTWFQGGDAAYAASGSLGTNTLEPSEIRKSALGRMSWDFTDSISAYAQASWARYQGASYYVRPQTTPVLIRPDNAYLLSHPNYAQLIAAYPNGFRIGTENADFPQSGSANRRQTYRYLAGAEGDFVLAGLGVAWDAYYQRGQTKTEELLTNTYSNALLNAATDAVLSNGVITCRVNADASLANDMPGCVPLNRLGTGVANPNAIAYVNSDIGAYPGQAFGGPYREQKFTQDVAALRFSTNDITGWAGPISVATGIEWRKEQSDGSVHPWYEPGSQFNGPTGVFVNNTWKYGNYRVTKGDYSVKEGFLETVVPVFSGFDLSGAVRFTDYSVTGSVTTWKLGATWQPIPDIKLRGTRSRDIRSPNLSELFDPGTGRGNSVAIPNNPANPTGASTNKQFTQRLQGSTLLQPETADGISFGVVFTPTFLDGFGASVDYYKVEVDDVISSLSVENTVNNCYVSLVERYCDNIVWASGTDSDGDGAVTGTEGNALLNELLIVNLYYENLQKMTSEGLDVEASYRFPLSRIAETLPGNLAFRLQGTHYIKNVTDNGVTAINQAGSNNGSTPDWSLRLQTTYKLADWSWNLIARGFTDGVLSKAYTECTSGCPATNTAAGYYTINENDMPGAVYFDGSVTRDFTAYGGEAEVFLSITNLLDKDPYINGGAFSTAENKLAYLQTNRGLYDVLGRRFQLGVRVKF